MRFCTIKSFNEVCCNESFKTCIAILYVAVLYSTVDVDYFYKTSGNTFFHDKYVGKVLLMNTFYSTGNISVMHVISAQETLPILESQFASHNIYFNARQNFSLKFGA
jgi:hypothetical protein